MKALLLSLALLSGAAQADEIIVHVGSWHSKPGFCNFNPGIGYQADSGLTLGLYRNSECDASAYLGWTWWTSISENTRFSLTAGAATGYARASVIPMLLPAVTYHMQGFSIGIGFLPRVEKRGAAVAHLFLKTEL